MQILDLETPALLLDVRRMDDNIELMHRHLNGLGATFRPHLKTAKNSAIARRLVEGQSGGITVSTLKEADYFAAAGFNDILYAVGIAPNSFFKLAS